MSCVCSSGYTLVDGICVIDTPALSGSSGVTIYTIGYPTDSFNTTEGRFAKRGVFFYEDITNKVKPLTFFNNSSFTPPSTVAVAPGQPSILVDGTNFTPSSASSYYGYDDVNISGVPISVLATASTTNTLWCSNNSPTNGRMNLAGIRAYFSGNSGSTLNQWIGIPFCIDVPSTQQYHILFGADDVGSIILDNEWLVKRINNNTSGTIISDGALDKRGVDAGIFLDFNHVIPITLDAGNHIFEFYWSDVGGTPTNGIFEIYSGVTTAQLTGFTANTQLNPYIVATTSAYSNNVLSTLIYPPISGTTPNGGLYCTGDSVLFSACTSPFCRSQEFLTSYCIYGTNTIYDDNYNSSGEWNGRAYWLGENNGYVIYYSTGDTQWCLSSSLGGSCLLSGKSPCYEVCPDLCSEYCFSGVCPTPTPSPTNACDLDFSALFDCEVTPTPSITPTISTTPTMTPTPSTSPLCSVIGVDVSINSYTPTPTPTPTVTPSSTPIVTRTCSFSGDVTFNIIDTSIVCPFSKEFQDCYNGQLYYTHNNVTNPTGGTIDQFMIFNAYVDGDLRCISYVGNNYFVSGINDIELVSGPIGFSNLGDCTLCSPTLTPTSTPTPTPTPTPSSVICYCYELTTTTDEILFSYINCSGFTDSVNVTPFTSTTVCSITTPTTLSLSTHGITNRGLCSFNICPSYNCESYSISNLNTNIVTNIYYIDCYGVYQTLTVAPVIEKESTFVSPGSICSTIVPISDNPNVTFTLDGGFCFILSTLTPPIIL